MRKLLIAAAVVVVALLAVLHWSLLQEAYGAGPPYYGRTVNMDKWNSPWPVLVAVDLTAVVVFAVVRGMSRRWGSMGSQATAASDQETD